MTRLFNLESYIDACQYTRIFQKSPDQVIPDSREKYKALLEKYAENRYLSPPIINNHRPSKLTINSSPLNYLSVGNELTVGEQKRLFIISDTLDLMTLSTSNILGRGDGYLYSSAYHYWNHYHEIHQYQITKSLVFIDLDNFGISNLIPVSLDTQENSRYQTPILDTRNQILLDHIFDCPAIYKNIFDAISQRILTHFFALLTNTETVNHLSNYLQKINFLQLIQSCKNQETVDLIIEIKPKQQIFYKQITLLISDVAKIICEKINFTNLQKIANQYPQYQFVLVSQYNIFAEHIHAHLPNFIILQPNNQQFQQIWTEKNHVNFPLFAIYLDNIEFAVGIAGKVEWIKLSAKKDVISYEGKPTELIGSIPSLNQDFVRIIGGRSNASLPIRVNGEDYCINGKKQVYKIEIENYQGTEETLVQIQFNLQTGSFPELKVRDLKDRYKIKNFIDNQQTYSYIPPSKITENRQQRSLAQIERLQKWQGLTDFLGYLHQISDELDKIQIHKISNLPINYQLSKEIINSACRAISFRQEGLELLQFVDTLSDTSIVDELKSHLQYLNLNKIVDIIYQLLADSHDFGLSASQQKWLVNAIIFTGKLYQFSEYIFPDRLFDNLELQFYNASQIRYGNLANEYLQCLARIAVTKKLQRQYFNLFESQYNLENSQYLWGYGRILLWSYNFNSSESFLNYREHFMKIMNLLTKPHISSNYIYKQNAFLALIYLVTFRAHNSTFCQPKSQEFLLAKQVIEHFKDDKIMLNTISREKPLNEYFEEIIEGHLSADEIDDILQG
jgi:hypothetical protein